ncbi:hypothetical protein [Archangium sp.]|uniref:hypothetical protein n=1 Tax=Archangium sp. TaxID=1872627 RepID=UPI002D4A823C|nr:hypothetical protein [Archangium sp.]HYO56816.1 hypothetical protein [Archangium sp.]
MKERAFSFYEYAGIVVPGTALLFGLFFVLPEIKSIFLKGGFGVGDLGLFVIISYVAGHLIAAVGNLLELFWWGLRGGMPSLWVVRKNQRLLAPEQIVKLEARVRARLGLQSITIVGMEPGRWEPVFGQLRAEVAREGRDARAEIFNGNYGMSRGIASAFLMVALINVAAAWTEWRVTLVSILLFLLALTRMNRFGIHYARAMLWEFLQLPESEKERLKVTVP